MKITVKGRDTKVTPALQEYVERKIIKLEKLLDFDEASAVLKVCKEKHRAEITIPLTGALLRAEQETFDMYESIDLVIEKLERQIEKYKSKWGKKGRGTVRTEEPITVLPAEETEIIIRSKHFPCKPMPIDEAITRMNLLEHNFFAFTNSATDEINVIYKRNDGGYGLLEPEK